MVEQSPEKACVGGSIPSLATTSLATFLNLEVIIQSSPTQFELIQRWIISNPTNSKPRSLKVFSFIFFVIFLPRIDTC